MIFLITSKHNTTTKLFNGTNFILFFFFFFQLTVVAKDISNKPNSAVCNVVIDIVRNKHTPVFGKIEYNVGASDTQRAGTVLETLAATDEDLNEPLSKDVSIIVANVLIDFFFSRTDMDVQFE